MTTPAQAKIEAFEEAKRILKRALGEGWTGECIEELFSDDINLEIAKLKRMKPPASPSNDFNGFADQSR